MSYNNRNTNTSRATRGRGGNNRSRQTGHAEDRQPRAASEGRRDGGQAPPPYIPQGPYPQYGQNPARGPQPQYQQNPIWGPEPQYEQEPIWGPEPQYERPMAQPTMPPPMRTRQETFYQRQWGRHPGAAPIYTQGWAGAMTPDELTYEEDRMEIDDLPQPPPHAEAERRHDMRAHQQRPQYAAPPGLQRGPHMQPRGRHERETRAETQQGPRTESRSSREEQYEARPQMKNKQKAQDKEPENEDEGINFIQAQLESLGIDASFTGFLKDPTAQYVVSKLVDIATSEKQERERLESEREHWTRSKKNLEGQLTTALAKRQISPPMDEIDARRAKKSREASPRREIIPLPQMRPRSQPPQQYQQPIAGPSTTRIASSQSDNTPRREPPLPYNEVAVPRGLGPKYTARSPNITPGAEIIPDPNTEENAPKTKQSDESTSDEEGENLERISTPEHETPNEKRLRNQKNVDREAKKARLVREGKQRREKYEKSQPGRIPDAIGVIKNNSNGQFERDNWMRGSSDPEFYYSRISNTVYVGPQAQVAATSEGLKVSSQHIPTTAVYYKAPRGFPMNPQQVIDVLKLIRETKVSPRERVEAFRLIREFRRIAYAFLPSQRDLAMHKVLEDYPYQQVKEMITNQRFRDYYAEKFEPFGSEDAYKKDNNGRTKAGVSQLHEDQTLNIDAWAQYIVHHWRPGGDNPLNGAAINRAYHANRRSIFGYLIAKALGPRTQEKGSGTIPKSHFTRQYAILVAKPQAYREAITQWEQETGNKFSPINTIPSSVTLKRIPAEQCSANITQDDITRLLIENRIPPAWIDHAYTFGIYYLDHQIWNALNKEAYIEADDERLRRLAEHGLPPPIRAWDGWYIPTEEDKIRIRYLIRDEVKNKNIKCLESNEWLFIGEEVHPIYLRSRSTESAEYLYDTERQRIDVLRHAEQAVGENPHDPEGVLDATNVTPGMTNVVPGTTEDEKMIEDTDENPPSAEPSELNRSEAMSSSAGDEPAATSSSEGS
ncbi:hypothetical protein BD779DRAFT_1679075 [Infundibulicybe gibba]|nr:hypothetical protein BD779DRAFT_1679075 [Infundibulicybe gibba]